MARRRWYKSDVGPVGTEQIDLVSCSGRVSPRASDDGYTWHTLVGPSRYMHNSGRAKTRREAKARAVSACKMFVKRPLFTY